jgi:hypothetical protein
MSEKKLKEWIPNFEGVDFFSMIIIASRRSGKSTLVKYIIEQGKLIEKYDYFIVLSENDDSLDYLSNFIPGNLFIKNFEADIIDNLVQVSEKLELEMNAKSFLMIIDDMTGNDIKYNLIMTKIYAMGRHLRIGIIWLSQQMKILSTTSRNNSDYILIGRSSNAKERYNLINDFLNGTLDDDFEKSNLSFYRNLLKEYTKNYGFIVIDNTIQDHNFDDTIKYIRVKL